MNQQTIHAIYQNGVLHPIGSLDLPENSEVELRVEIVENNTDLRRSIGQLLERKGLSLKMKTVSPKQILSDGERERIAQVFSSPQPLGELISQDREENF